MPNPRISVLLPVFNAERYLDDAIRSILKQTLTDFELLVMDDGSSDRSLSIAEDAARKDSRVVLLKGAHRGYVRWLNEGLRLARAEFVARMDADDISLPDRFAKQAEFLKANPAYSAVGGSAEVIDPDGAPIQVRQMLTCFEDIDSANLRGCGSAMIHPATMFRRSFLVQAGGYRENFEPAEDYDLFLRLAEFSRIANLDRVVLQYRQHLAATSILRAEAQRQNTRRALEECWERRGRTDPMPEPVATAGAPGESQLRWSWIRAAFREGNYSTARKHAYRLLREKPTDTRRWALAIGACLGPVAKAVKGAVGIHVGTYR